MAGAFETMEMSAIVANRLREIRRTAASAGEAKQDPQAFLKKTAEEQQAQISLALLVDERTACKRVRQFGGHMTAIHKDIRQEVQELAVENEVHVPAEWRDEHKQKFKEFSRLSGHASDRTDMHDILRGHQMDSTVATDKLIGRSAFGVDQGVRG